MINWSKRRFFSSFLRRFPAVVIFPLSDKSLYNNVRVWSQRWIRLSESSRKNSIDRQKNWIILCFVSISALEPSSSLTHCINMIHRFSSPSSASLPSLSLHFSIRKSCSLQVSAIHSLSLPSMHLRSKQKQHILLVSCSHNRSIDHAEKMTHETSPKKPSKHSSDSKLRLVFRRPVNFSHRCDAWRSDTTIIRSFPSRWENSVLL